MFDLIFSAKLHTELSSIKLSGHIKKSIEVGTQIQNSTTNII